MALGLLAVFVLTLATGYFVAQEFAYVSADRLSLSQHAAAGDAKAVKAVKVLERLSFMLSGAQLGITVTALLVGFIAKPALAELLAPALKAAGVPENMVGGIALALGFVLATVIQMVLGELAPKNWALARPERLARALAGSTLIYLAIAGPLIKLFDTASNKLLRMVGIEPVEELHHGATLEELGHIIGESQAHGHLPGSHADVLERALAFSEHTADEVMVPRVDVVTISAGASVADLDELIATYGHTHYPVLREPGDEVAGIISLGDVAAIPAGAAAATRIADLAQEVLVVPFSASLPSVVAQMHVRGREVTCVLNEHGGLAGLLTWEDIAEELVGEIADENDADDTSIVARGQGWDVDAGLRIDEIALATGLELPDADDYDTLAGLILHRLGRFATAGDLITVELPPSVQEGAPTHARLQILSLERHVPHRVHLSPARPTPDEHQDDSNDDSNDDDGDEAQPR